MGKKFRSIYRQILQSGINPIMIWRSIKGLPKVLKQQYIFKKQNNNKVFPIKNQLLILNDLYEEGGVANGHYFHQDLLVAQKIFNNKPIKHVDIGSRVDGFISHVAVFRDIEVFDIRSLKSKTDTILFKKADLMELDSAYIDYCDSISSLHAIEHFGLGRYGDPINANGHLDGLNNIYKILKKGGKFYFSVPIGSQRIEFNAHRVFNIQYLLDLFDGKYELISFSFVDDKGDLHQNIKLTEEKIKNNCGTYYGCGIFELVKK